MLLKNSSVSLLSFKLLKLCNRLLDCCEVCKHTAKPSVGDIRHAASLCLCFNSLLSLLLCTDEENLLLVVDLSSYSFISLNDASTCLLKVDDVDSVSLCEDETSHLWIPSLCLMAEMYAWFQQALHCYYCHSSHSFRKPFLAAIMIFYWSARFPFTISLPYGRKFGRNATVTRLHHISLFHQEADNRWLYVIWRYVKKQFPSYEKCGVFVKLQLYFRCL